MKDQSIKLCGVTFQNPTVLASGVLGVAAETMTRVHQSGCGAVTLKSLTNVPRAGNKSPIVVGHEHYFLNAVGLSGMGDKNAEAEVRQLKANGVPVIASVFSASFDETAELAATFQGYGADLIELNVSCPHTQPGEKIGSTIGTRPDLVEQITATVKKKISIPLIVKLTPNVTDIVEIAKVAEAAGADCIAAVNTFGPGLKLDIETMRPILSNKLGGVSGPGIFPLALACVWKISEAVKIPILAMGGITTWSDALEMIMAGATAVGIGTAVYYQGIEVFQEVSDGMAAWMDSHGYTSYDQIRGIAHQA